MLMLVEYREDLHCDADVSRILPGCPLPLANSATLAWRWYLPLRTLHENGIAQRKSLTSRAAGASAGDAGHTTSGPRLMARGPCRRLGQPDSDRLGQPDSDEGSPREGLLAARLQRFLGQTVWVGKWTATARARARTHTHSCSLILASGLRVALRQASRRRRHRIRAALRRPVPPPSFAEGGGVGVPPYGAVPVTASPGHLTRTSNSD